MLRAISSGKSVNPVFRGNRRNCALRCDITRYDDMSIAILDENRHSIQLFDVNGVFLRQIDLHQTGNRESVVPGIFRRGFSGRISVYYVGIDSPCATGSHGRRGADPKTNIAPRFSDGRPVAVDCGVRRAPDGRLWVTDGDVLLRLSDDGTVDRILGEEAIRGNPETILCGRRPK